MTSFWSSLGTLWKRPRGRKVPLDAILISAAAHLVLLIGAAYLTVMVIQGRGKVMFEGRKSPSIAARKLEHSIRVKQVQKQSRKPQILQRLVSAAPSKVALPEMPHLEMPDLKNLKDAPLISSRAGATLGGLGGLGGGAGRGLTGGSGYSDTKFFGENVRTRAICILMDISQSVVVKGIVEDVRREAIQMLQNLSPVTAFNLIVFVDGAESFSPQMVFATQENKEKALAYLQQQFNGAVQGNRRGFSGSTCSEAVRVATEMGCDTMFVITDDPPYLKTGDATTGIEIPDHPQQILDYAAGIESKYGRKVTIHTICYKPWLNERGERAIVFMKQLARSTGGRFRLIKREEGEAPGRPDWRTRGATNAPGRS